MARHPSSTPSKGDLHIVFKIIFPSYEAIAGSEEKKEVRVSLNQTKADLSTTHRSSCDFWRI